MIRKKADRKETIRSPMYEGQGDVLLISLLNGPDEMNGKGRVFSEITVQPGDSIGFHVHKDESETFYVVQGQGEFDDNGTVTPFEEGDVLFTPVDHGHSLRNTGTVPLKVIALVLYK